MGGTAASAQSTGALRRASPTTRNPATSRVAPSLQPAGRARGPSLMKRCLRISILVALAGCSGKGGSGAAPCTDCPEDNPDASAPLGGGGGGGDPSSCSPWCDAG